MKVKLRFEGIAKESHEDLSALVRDWANRHVAPKLSKGSGEGATLVGTLTRRKRGAEKYDVRLHLPLPGKRVVAANAAGKDIRAVLETALERLLRETDRHLVRLRKQDEYRRRARRQRLHELKTRIAALPQDVARAAQQSLDRLIARLERVARHELAYLRAAGDLPSDYPTLRDVVDETLASVKGAWTAQEEGEALFRRLLRVLFKVMDHEVAASRQFGEMLSLEAPPAPDAEDQAEVMVGEEFHEFYQPDAALQLADVIADEEAPLPESEAAEAERRYMIDVVKDLPITWRRALLLHELEDMPQKEIAWVLDSAEMVVAAWIDHANAFVAAKAAQAGICCPPGDPLARIKESRTDGAESPE